MRILTTQSNTKRAESALLPARIVFQSPEGGCVQVRCLETAAVILNMEICALPIRTFLSFQLLSLCASRQVCAGTVSTDVCRSVDEPTTKAACLRVLCENRCIPQASGSLTVFPNPATHFLNLRITNAEQQQLRYQLYDLQGKLLDESQVVTGNTRIATSHLPSGMYLLSVRDQMKALKTFRIIKN